MSFEDLAGTVIEKDLCVRCGVCIGTCPAGAIGTDGRCFPVLTGKCTDCGFCTAVCPGKDVDFPGLSRRIFRKPFYPKDWLGHQQKMWVGHATDDTVRRSGSSGGMATGLLIYLLRTRKINGAAVVVMDPLKPWRAKSLLAKTEEEIRLSAKSKYCIVPSMDVLARMRKENGPFAVIGLPCQIHGIRKLERVDPKLAGKIKYVFGLYCHYNQETDFIKDLMRISGYPLESIAEFQFRGGEWPGKLNVTTKNGIQRRLNTVPNKTIWSVTFRLYGAKRCFLCTDATSEFADLAFGDFWARDYKDTFRQLRACTLCSQRTDTGREVLESAMKDGEIQLYELPESRYPRRTIAFAREKKTEAFIRLKRFTRQGKAVPDYGHPIPESRWREWSSEWFHHGMLRFFHRPPLREKVLALLLTRFARILDRGNTLRKEMVHRYRKN